MKGRIGFAINSLAVGGAERVFVDDMNYLHQRGHEVHCILFVEDTTRCALLRELELPRERIHFIGRRSGVLDLRTFRNLWTCVRRTGIQTLYATLDKAILVSLTIALLRPSLRVVIRFAGIPAAKALRFKIGDTLLGARANAVACVSQAIASAVHRRIPGSRSRTVVLRNGVPIRPVRTLDNTHAIQILSVGSLNAHKNHDLLIDAFAKLAKHPSQPTLHLVGDGRVRAQLQHKAATLGLDSRILFHGRKRHEDLGPVYASSALFVLPSLHEGCPNALLEAMSHGLACIATDVAGMDEIIEHGISGLIVPSNNPEAMSQAIASLLDSPELRERIGTQARVKITREFSREQHQRQLESLLLSE